MKNLILAFVILFSTLAFSQRVIERDLKTIANSVNETGYIDLSGWKKIDSISVTYAGLGEMDVDSLTIYGAVKVGNSFITDLSVLINFTVTLNLAAGVYDIERLFVSNAGISGALLRGLNALYYVTRGATSGNDPTDPNRAWVTFQIWGTQ